MAYLVFARKFRPQRFEEVVGQEPIITTLQNAIREKRIAQSFLFSGTRGVGKTSTARILAKALNCEKGVVPEPCGECLNCQEITQGSSLDVLEIDGASNRGIDEIRNLRENVKFKPVQGRFRIYIIDEVHMLTPEAFNALLKTLEEPPEHVKFIFATTELHKVPPTILSRCQKYAFRKVALAKVVQKLEAIAQLEKIACDEKSLFSIAKVSEGSLRDAESLLDQMASFTQGKITYDKIVSAFGIPSDEVYIALVDAVIAKDAKKILEIFSPLAFEGKDMVQFVRGLTEVFRALLVLKVVGKDIPELIELSPETCRELELRSSQFSKEDLLSSSYLLQSLLRDVRRSLLPELHVETVLIKLAIRENVVDLSEIVRQFDSLRNQLSNKELGFNKPGQPVSQDSKKEPGKKSALRETLKPPLEKSEDSVPPQTALTLNDIERVWADAVERVKTKKMSCGMFLSEASPVEVEDHLIVLGLPGEFKFHKESLEKGDNKRIVEDIFQAVLGTQVKVSFVITVPEKVSLPSAAGRTDQGSVPEIVESALKLFEGKIVQKS